MADTLKTIKIIFSVDVEKFRQNVRLAEKAIDSASKQVENANKSVEKVNRDLTTSSEEFAHANRNAAQSTEKLAKSSNLLTGSLNVLKGSLQVLGDVVKLSSISLLGIATAFIKFFPLIQKTEGALLALSVGLENVAVKASSQFFSLIQKTGGALLALSVGFERATVKASLLYANGLLLVARGLAKLGPRFLFLQRGVVAASGGMTSLTLKVTAASFALSKFLKGLVPIQAVLQKGSKGAEVVAARIGTMGAAAVAGSRSFGLLTKSLKLVGIATVPFLNKLLSIGAILPTLGAAIAYIAVRIIGKLIGALKRAGERALKFAKSIASTADQLAKTSLKLGLHVETLQQYQFAATLAGVKQEQFNVGLQRFLRRTAEARQGTGVLKKEFDRLGIALVDSQGYVRDGIDVFEDYIAAIGKTADKQEQLRLAFAAFDTEGVALVNLAKGGKEALLAQRQEAERLGLVLSTGLLKSYEQINDQLTINQKRVEAARLKNSLFLAQMTVKWDNFKTSVKVATQELLSFVRPFEALTLSELEAKLKSTEVAIARTSKALNSSIANLPLVTGTLEIFLGGLIEDQERILEAMRLAQGEDLKVAAERPDEVTRQIREQIALQERRLEQQQRLTQAAKEGAVARQQVANLIEAENAARALGNQATEEERRKIVQLTVALREKEQAEQAALAANRELLAGEELRISALGRLEGQLRSTDSALVHSVETLMTINGTTVKMQREFDKLSQKLRESSSALEKIEQELKQTAKSGEGAKKKYRELGKEADHLRREVEKARTGLEKLKVKLEDQALGANTARVGIRNLSQEYGNARASLEGYNRELEENQRKLRDTAAEAENVGEAIEGVGRQVVSLGAVVQGDVNDPANIERALNDLNAKLRQASFSTGAAGRIQQRILRAEIDRLEEDLRLANEQARKDIVAGILRAHEELTGDALEEALAQEMALRQRYGILPSAGSSKPSFQGVQSSRW